MRIILIVVLCTTALRGCYVEAQTKIGAMRQHIESAAASENAADQSTVEKVVGSVLDLPKAFPEPPGKPVLKSYIVSRETDYLNGKNPGISEEGLTKFVNYLSQKLGTPPSGKTSVEQVHEIRARLAVDMPTFVKIQDKRMSPAQAVHVLTTLFNQKMLNPDFQVEPERWSPESTIHEGHRVAHPIAPQLQKSVHDGIDNMSIAGAAEVAQKFARLLQGEED